MMDLGSDSSVSKKDAKLGFVVNYTNLLLIADLYGVSKKDAKLGFIGVTTNLYRSGIRAL